LDDDNLALFSVEEELAVVFGVDEDDAQDEGVGVEGVDRLCEPWNV
jgi:hypothetical protein